MKGVRRILSATLEAAVWTRKYINSLPNSSFAYIEPEFYQDHKLDRRHLPYRDKSGKIDIPHLKNAMSRLTQTHISESAMKQAHNRLLNAYRQVGLEHPSCSVPGCKGYTPAKKSFLEDYKAFSMARREFAEMHGPSRFFPNLA
jgi:hypothetical protein